MSVLGNDVLFNFRAPQGMELQREQYVKIHLLSSSLCFLGVFSVEGLMSFNCSSINSAAFFLKLLLISLLPLYAGSYWISWRSEGCQWHQIIRFQGGECPKNWKLRSFYFSFFPFYCLISHILPQTKTMSRIYFQFETFWHKYFSTPSTLGKS